MKVLIWGSEARYRADLPHAVQSLPLELVFCPREQPLESMLPRHADTVFLFVDAIAPVDSALMDRMPGLRLIHSEGVAYNAIDLEAARRRSIFVCNNKGCNAAPTAEMAVMLMLMSLRFGIPGDRAVREGRQIQFKEGIMASGGPELGERTVGLVGFGDIAQAVARRLRPFGCSLFYYAPHRRPPEVEAGFGVSYLPLEELFASCDLLSLHCAVTPETRGMVNAALLERVRPGTILINTARGDLLDNQAVRQALIEGRLGGAGFDVLSPEPTHGDHPLVDLPPEVRDRVVYAPHLGGITSASFRRSHAWMWASVQAMLEGGRPGNIVNGL